MNEIGQGDWQPGRPLLTDQNSGGEPESAGLNLGFADICFILYRHKWKIIICSLLGFIAAAGMFITTPKLYLSEAEVMVKYVPERESLGPGETEAAPKNPVRRGEEVIASEIEIIGSMDLATNVAQAIGPERILAAAGGGDNLNAAARLIHKGTKAFVAGGNVMGVTFEHPDPTIVQPVLSLLIREYFTKHWQVHQAMPGLDDISRQAELLSATLGDKSQKIWELKTNNGAFNLQEAKRKSDDRVSKAEDDLSAAQTELKETQAILQTLPDEPQPEAPSTNPEGREELFNRYAALMADIKLKKDQVSSLLGQYKPDDTTMVGPVRQELTRLETLKRNMEKQEPLLLGSGGDTNQVLTPALVHQKEKKLIAKIDVLQTNLMDLRQRQAKVYQLDSMLSSMQGSMDLDSSTYSYYTKNLRQAQFDSALGAARYSNISPVEAPTPPTLQVALVFKRIAMVAVGGIAVGIGLAFLLEFFIDQSIKRPAQLQKLLPLPVYLSLPAMRNRAPRRLLKDAQSASLADRPSQRALPPPSSSLDERLQPYFEALRDRVLNRFDTLARRPKLVGVCGCGEGSGSSIAAAGLAAALSEAGDLKILLVEMANGKHRATSLASSKNSCNLLEALEGPKREEGLIAPNLYRASVEGMTNGSAVTSPTRFPTMVPKLTASDYDYIIFDLPPVDQISITPRLSKHMDLTLLVVEAEKTHRNRIKQAGSLLLEFTPNVATVLNNTDAKLPRWLQQAL